MRRKSARYRKRAQARRSRNARKKGRRLNRKSKDLTGDELQKFWNRLLAKEGRAVLKIK